MPAAIGKQPGAAFFEYPPLRGQKAVYLAAHEHGKTQKAVKQRHAFTIRPPRLKAHAEAGHNHECRADQFSGCQEHSPKA